MQFRRQARRTPNPSHADSPQAPRSAAWLAGEQLFQAPPPGQPDAAPAVVTFRRSKRGASTAPHARAAGMAQGGVDEKGPRVFRVETTGNVPVANDPVAEAPVPVPAKVPLRKRVGVDRRPGPVVVQVFAVEPVAQEAELPGLEEMMATLKRQLAELTQALADAQRAQALQFIVEG